MHDVFISYATEDAELAQSACRRLEAEGMACWIAPRDIGPGQVYAEAIVDAIAGARAIVLLLSASANASAHVHREVELAGGQAKPIVPVLLERLEPAKALQYFIRSSQWLTAAGTPEQVWLDSLATSVGRLLSRTLQVGTTLGERLRLEAVIGEGGMGTVYLAEHLYLGRKVAVKVLKPGLVADESARRRFLEEARRATMLEHPNIVRMHDAGIEDGLPYLVLDYLEGGDLRALLAGKGALEPPETLAILDPVAQALDFAHERGLVHRDVKPGNILIDSGGHVYLTDFGIARQLAGTDGTTRAGAFVGTLEYAAPEQIRGGEISAATDVYALGCVLYHCLVGAPPFEGDTELDLMKAHTELPRPKASERRPGLPPAVDAVVATAMAMEPSERQETCAALVAQARAALEGGAETRLWLETPPPKEKEKREEKPPTEKAQEPPGRPPGGRPTAKRKQWAVAAVAALAAVIGIVAWAVSGGGDETASSPPPETGGLTTAPGGGASVATTEETPPVTTEEAPPVTTEATVTTEPTVTTEAPVTTEAVTEELDPGFPGGKTADEEILLSLIPTTARDCRRYQSARAVLAAVECDASAGILVYHELSADYSQMYRDYESFVGFAGTGFGSGNCDQPPPVENFWTLTRDGTTTTEGRLLCYVDPRDALLWAVWTHDALRILTFATQAPDQPTLYGWWSDYVDQFRAPPG